VILVLALACAPETADTGARYVATPEFDYVIVDYDCSAGEYTTWPAADDRAPVLVQHHRRFEDNSVAYWTSSPSPVVWIGGNTNTTIESQCESGQTEGRLVIAYFPEE
jgi:hypothetical protein